MLTLIVAILSFWLGAMTRAERDNAVICCAPMDEDPESETLGGGGGGAGGHVYLTERTDDRHG